MKAKRTILILLLLAVVLAGSAGALGNAVSLGKRSATGGSSAQLADGPQANAMGSIAHLFSLPGDDVIGLRYVRAEGPAFSSPGVARARGQVYQNENRKQIAQFIAKNPGARLYDITSALKLNIGTVRYHLMILSLNHVLTPYQDGATMIRYFAGAGSYSLEEMKVIALLKREPTRKLLEALDGQGGLTGGKLVAATGLPYSDVNRYLKELTAKGVVAREPVGKAKYQYRIAPELEGFVASGLEPLK